MHLRIALTFTIAGLLVAYVAAPGAHAVSGIDLAQQPGEGPGAEGEEGQDPAGEGQGDPEAETGAGGGETEEGTAEPGPPWTYQMARIVLALTVLLALGMGYLYYRLVVVRRRGEI